MVDLTPKYSPTKLPGYNAADPWVQGPNGPLPGGMNHPIWMSTVIDALVTDWVNGGRGLPGGWNASFGTPDPSDAPGKPASARTITAFSNYVANYRPGQSEWIDGNFSYVPPGPNDFVESPEQVALRVDQERWDKQFDVQFGPTAQAEKEAARLQRQYEFGEQLKLDQARLAMQGSAQAAEMAYQNAKLALEREGLNAEAAWRNAQIELEREKMKLGEEQFNKTLSLQYEQLWLQKEEAADRRALAVADIQQKRANTLAELGANPGDAVQREFAARLGTEPLGTPVDIFTGQPGATDSATLSQVMARQADKLRPFAQRGMTGAPASTPGFVNDPLAVVGDSPSGEPTGFEEVLVNPTGAPVGILSNDDLRDLGMEESLNNATRRARGTFSSRFNRGNLANDHIVRPMPMQESWGNLSNMFRGMRRFADGTGFVGPGSPVSPPPPEEWEMITDANGRTVRKNKTTGTYSDPATGQEITDFTPFTPPATPPDTIVNTGATGHEGPEFTVLEPPPRRPNGDPHEIWVDSKGTIWRPAPDGSARWINVSTGEVYEVPQPNNAAGLIPYWGGWWDPKNGPPPAEPQNTPYSSITPLSARINPNRVRRRASRGEAYDRNGRRLPPETETPPAEPPPAQPPPAQPPPGGTGTGPTTGNALLDALLAKAGIDILSYGPDVYKQLAKLLLTPGVDTMLSGRNVDVPALGLTGENALPAANRMNYTDLSNLERNAPETLQLLSSLYRAGNQSLPNLMAAVRARAPLGTAYRSSLIQT